MEEIKKKLKASFKSLQGNRIISTEQNCDCPGAVTVVRAPTTPSSLFLGNHRALQRKLRFSKAGILKVAPRATSKE